MNKQHVGGVCVLFFTILSDFITKKFAPKLGMEVIKNDGISFNLLSQMNTLILTICLFGLLISLWLSLRSFFLQKPLGSGLFFGGAAANILDRLFFGGVRDWLPIPFISGYNNVADWALFFGITFLIVPEIFRKQENDENRYNDKRN